MNKDSRKLINHVGHFLKLISEDYTLNAREFKVDYRFPHNKAYVYIKPKTVSVSNGYDRYYDWDFLDKLFKLSEKEGISYKIGCDCNIELNIQIYV